MFKGLKICRFIYVVVAARIPLEYQRLSDQTNSMIVFTQKKSFCSMCLHICTTVLFLFFCPFSINKSLPLSQSNSSLQVISTLVLRVLSYTSTAESSSSYKLTLEVILDVDQLLPTLLQDITASLNSKYLDNPIVC